MSKGSGVGGYLAGALTGLVLVGVGLVALVALDPQSEDLRLAEPEPTEQPPETAPGQAAEPAPEAVIEPGLEPADEEPPPPGSGLSAAPTLQPIEPGLGEPPATGTAPDEPEEAVAVEISPVEPEELPGELAPSDGTAGEVGGADEIPPELRTILEGVSEEAEQDGRFTLDVEEEELQSEGEELALAEEAGDLPPPLPEARPPELSGPALSVNAASYQAQEGQPLLAVMFDATDAGDLDPEVLFALPVPATLGIIAGREGDEALAAAARARDWEVVAQFPVVEDAEGAPPGALSADMAPEEVAQRTEALLGRLDEAVAATAGGELSDPESVEAMLDALERHGFGYVVAPGAGGAPGDGPARAEPTGLVPVGATAEEVYAALEEAAEGAGAAGTGLVVLPPTRAAVEALARWNAEQGGGRVAPLSAVIGRRAGG